MSAKHKSIGEDLWKTRTDKLLFAFTYGALVVRLIQDYGDWVQYGIRLIEDFLARSSLGRCADFKEVGEVVAKVGFKTFINVIPRSPCGNSDNVFCGVLRGCLEMVQMQVEAKFVSDALRRTTELKVTLLRYLEEMPAGDDCQLPWKHITCTSRICDSWN
ncbi:hypothetical protein BS47DRAFT_1370339 [Hydnum rufescens UP504]|uniref:Uncharacterized protein n=1 Tax=Hydnum rufescens UP504 TaxID=1448309 RepID=A0A9P6BAC8_9AGAM|nr:hypothetical protein BS47DRAFT_1370339 [Hydnum rufescens UP504]